MEARHRLVVPPWVGFLLIVVGFLTFVGSYFLLPIAAVACFDDCPSAYFTAWEMSMRGLSNLPVFLGPSVIILVLCYLPLLAAVTLLVHPQLTFATWNHRAWLAGISALGIAFLGLFFSFIRPDIGYLGMLFGYALFWAGNRLLLTSHP
ncbi:MAG: hypothetical protein ACXWQR_02575 [Ktedonobacterales bacterium]